MKAYSWGSLSTEITIDLLDSFFTFKSKKNHNFQFSNEIMQIIHQANHQKSNEQLI